MRNLGDKRKTAWELVMFTSAAQTVAPDSPTLASLDNLQTYTMTFFGSKTQKSLFYLIRPSDVSCRWQFENYWYMFLAFKEYLET